MKKVSGFKACFYGKIGKVGVRYTRYLDVSAMMGEHIVEASGQVCLNQPTQAFNILNQPMLSGGREDAIHKTMRLSAIAPEESRKRLQDYHDGVLMEGLADDGELPTTQDQGIEDNASVVLSVAQPSVIEQPAPSTPPGAASARKSRASTGSHRSNSTDLDVVGDPTSPTTKRINSIHLDDLVAGENRAPKIRRFKEFMEEKKVAAVRLEEPTRTLECNRVKRMEDAYEVMEVGLAFTNLDNILAWEDEDYEKKTTTMVKFGVVFTPAQEEAMTERLLIKTVNELENNMCVKDWEVAVSMAKPEKGTGEFDCSSPKASDLSIPDSMMVLFSFRMVKEQFLAPLLRRCTAEHWKPTKDLLLSLAEMFVDQEPNTSKIFLEAGIAISTLLRAAAHVLDPFDTDNAAEYDECDQEEGSDLRKDSVVFRQEGVPASQIVKVIGSQLLSSSVRL